MLPGLHRLHRGLAEGGIEQFAIGEAGKGVGHRLAASDLELLPQLADLHIGLLELMLDVPALLGHRPCLDQHAVDQLLQVLRTLLAGELTARRLQRRPIVRSAFSGPVESREHRGEFDFHLFGDQRCRNGLVRARAELSVKCRILRFGKHQIVVQQDVQGMFQIREGARKIVVPDGEVVGIGGDFPLLHHHHRRSGVLGCLLEGVGVIHGVSNGKLCLALPQSYPPFG